MATAAPAAAEACGDEPGCGGEVINNAESYGAVWIANQWCWHWTTGVTLYEGDRLPCVDYWNSWGHARAAAPLPPGDRYDRNTDNSDWSSGYGPAYYDTDAIWVPDDCVMNYDVSHPLGTSRQVVDRRGKSSLWVKVYDSDIVYINSVSCLDPRAGGRAPGTGGGGGPVGGDDGGSGSGGSGSPGNEQKADLTGDGIADLARIHDNGHLYIYPGRGSVEPGVALWAPRDQGPDWAGSVSIATGDLNRDGIADLVRYHQNGHLYLYPGRGGSQATEPFWAPRDLGGDWGGTVSVALGDLNKDGIADLVRYHQNGHLYLYPGRGGVEASNAFWSPRDLGGDWGGTVSVALGDLNRDGIADLMRYHQNGHLYVYPGRGGVEAGNAFWSPRDHGGDWGGTVAITAGDLNRDGIADLARYHQNGHLYVYPGRGSAEPGSAFWAPRDHGGDWGGTVSMAL